MFSQAVPAVRLSIWILVTYTILWGIAVQIAMGTATNITTSFQIPEAMTYGVGATNAVGDVGVLLIPQPVIWKLQQSVRRKLFLSGVFFMGIMWAPPQTLSLFSWVKSLMDISALIVGIVRLPLLHGLPGQSHYDETCKSFVPLSIHLQFIPVYPVDEQDSNRPLL